MDTVAYVYKWIHISTGKWYIGSRTKVGCHPNDGYLCSSKLVKPLILATPAEWKREIIATGTPMEMYQLETTLLMEANAKHDANSFNQHNNDRSPLRTGIPHTLKSIQKMSGPRTPYGAQSPEHIGKRADKKRGQKRPDLSESNKNKVGHNNPNFGKLQSEEWKHKNRLAHLGKPKNKVECPVCGTIGGSGVMQRWHFDKCKQQKEAA